MQYLPFKISTSLCLDHLRLPRTEFGLLARSCIPTLSKDIYDVIYSLTRGHAPLARFTMEFLHENFEHGITDTALLIRSLASHYYIYNARVLSGLACIIFYDTHQDDIEFLRNVLYECDEYSIFTIKPPINPYIAAKFIRLGTITPTSDHRLQFTAPLYRIVLTEYVSKPIPLSQWPSFFKKLSGYGKSSERGSRRHEREWQMKWYKATRAIIPDVLNCSFHADLREVFGVQGMLNFHLNGSWCWGFELIRNGYMAEEYYEKMIADGKTLKEWAILDSRHEPVIDPQPGFWYIIYTDNCSKLTVQCKNKDNRILTLLS